MGEEYELDGNFGDFGLQERSLEDVTRKRGENSVPAEVGREEKKEMNREDQLYGVPYNPNTIPTTSAQFEISNMELSDKYFREY